jgi:hypothetical protein
MKIQLHKIFPLILVAVGILIPGTQLTAVDSASVEVILVEAGPGEGGVDKSLRQYAGTLERLFRFNSYRQVGRKQIRLNVPGSGSTSLPGGQSLKLEANKGSGRGLMADLNWTRGGKGLLHTKIKLQPGRPAVLGGPRTKSGGTHLLILTLR